MISAGFVVLPKPRSCASATSWAGIPPVFYSILSRYASPVVDRRPAHQDGGRPQRDAAAVAGGDGAVQVLGDHPLGASDVRGPTGAVEDDRDDPGVAGELPERGGGEGAAEVDHRAPGALFEVLQPDHDRCTESARPGRHHPRARHSGRLGRSAPSVVSSPCPG